MKFIGELKPFQFEGKEFALDFGFTVNGFTMGLGKTPTAIATACEVGEPTLVVAPAFLRENWLREIDKFCDSPKKFTVISYHQLKKLGRLPPTVIFDEAHYLKELSTGWTHKAHILVESDPPEVLLQLTGTPIKNRIPEIYSPLRLCWLGGYYEEFDLWGNSYDAFCNNFAHGFFDGYRQRYEGLKNRRELRRLLKPVYLRKRAEDVLDLPDMVHKEIITKKIGPADKELKRAWQLYKEQGNLSEEMASLKAVNALAKVDFTIEHCNSIIKEGQKVVVYTDHVQACKALAAGLNVEAITGQTPVKKRMRLLDDFQAGKTRSFVATIGSASVGLNITSANYTVFNDAPWVPADLHQAIKRTHRIGQRNTCFYYYILSSQYDAMIYQTIKKKMKIIDQVVE